MARLDRIRIAGYKSIRDQTIELRDLNVLIGANGAGKSNLLSVFKFLRRLERRELGLEVGIAGGASRVLHLGPKVTRRLSFDLEFDFGSFACDFKPNLQDGLVFEREVVKARDGRKVEFKGGLTETSLAPWPIALELEETARKVSDVMAGFHVFHFQDTGPSSPIKQSSYIGDNLILHEDGRNLAAFLMLRQLSDDPVSRNLIDTIRLVAPFFEGFVLRPSPLNPEYVVLEWKHRGSDEVFPASALSDGTLRFICLASLLVGEPSPGLLLLDEPELGLHPAAIYHLAGLIRSAATRTQVILATQSVTLLNQFTAEDILVAERQGEESVFRRPALDELASWLDEYSVGELWEKNLLGGRPAA